MADAARVTSVDALRDFKAALQSFAEDATIGLSEATSEAQRGLWYISTDCRAHWQRELKKRNEKLQQAKAELFKKQLESNDTRTSAVVERKHVQRWEQAVAQAEEKLRRIKYWSTALERDFMLFKAGVQSMSNIVVGDLPNVTARIERMVTNLEEYIRLAAPSSMTPRTASDAGEQREIASDVAAGAKSERDATSASSSSEGQSS